MKSTAVIAGIFAALSSYASANDATQAPEAGSYAANIYVQDASGTSCLDYSGAQYAGAVSFSGLSGTTDYLRVPLAVYDLAVTSVQALTVTSGKGTTHPSGKFSWTGGGFGQSWSKTGTFSDSITEVGTHTFVMQVMESYSGCSETVNVSLVRVSADQ